MAVAAPAGWPKDLPPPVTPEFGERVCGWLLDRGPAELRASQVRAMPIALARVVSHTLDAQIQGLRRAYATARVELGEHLTPEELVQVQHALQAEGARLLQVQRELMMVEAALRAE